MRKSGGLCIECYTLVPDVCYHRKSDILRPGSDAELFMSRT